MRKLFTPKQTEQIEIKNDFTAISETTYSNQNAENVPVQGEQPEQHIEEQPLNAALDYGQNHN